MRAVFHGELEQLGVELATMCGLAADAMEKASRALLGSDLVLAEQVISDDEELDAAQARCEEHAFVLLALQAPVARDLRLVVSAIQAAEKIERMGIWPLSPSSPAADTQPAQFPPTWPPSSARWPGSR